MTVRPRLVLSIVACVTLFVGLALLGGRTLERVRVDVTASNQHTLSDGALEIASSLERPVRLTLFYSSEVASRLPEVVAHAERVRRTLRRLEDVSGGMLIVDEVDPVPFSEAEERAINAGMTQVRAGEDTLFFGLSGSNTIDGMQGIGYLDPALADRLEYDIARVILLLARTDKPRVGLYSSLPLDGAMMNDFMQARPWAIYSELARLFELVPIEDDADALPDDLDALLVVHPKSPARPLVYAIDQAALGGLPVVVVVDPNCEIDVPAEAQRDPRVMARAVIASDLPELFASWGVAYSDERVVGDRVNATTVRTRRGDEMVSVDYVPYLRLDDENFNTGARAMQRLETLNIATSGYVRAAPNATTRFTPLITTSDEAMEILASQIRFSPDPQRLLRSYAPQGAFTLAASIEGPATTAFPGRAGRDHRASGAIRATVIGDADMFADRLWVEERRVGGEVVGAVRSADNAELLIGLLAEYVATDALLSIRPRENALRIFDRVASMRRAAQQEFAAEQRRLRDELDEAEARLNRLGAAGDGAGAFALAEQRREMERLRAARAEIRRRLRDVRFELDRDIEALGARVTLINIALAPALVVIGAVAIALVRRRQRTVERRRQREGASR